MKIKSLFHYFVNKFLHRRNKVQSFEPFDIRRGATLEFNEYFYALELQMKYHWLSKSSSKLESTIHTLLTERERRILFSKLLRKFVYVDLNSSHENVLKIVYQIEHRWNCDPNHTVIVAARKMCNNHPDGSNILVYNLQDELKRWKNQRFLSVFDIDNKRLINSQNIIVCDDFIGTGGTIDKRIQNLQNKFGEDKKIFVVALAAMKNSKKVLAKYNNVSVYSPVWVACGLNHDSDSKECAIMLNMEELLARKYKNYELDDVSLGYKKSGALYYNEQYRIPNNVYPIFWWGKLSDGSNFDSIFLRS